MAEVTIKAAQSFGGMRAGEVITVERTAYIEGLIERQRVEVVDDEVAQTAPQPAGADDLPTEPVVEFAAGDPAAAGPPARNAETTEWAEYMAVRFPDYDVTGKSRSELIAEYDARVPVEDGDTGDGSDQ